MAPVGAGHPVVVGRASFEVKMDTYLIVNAVQLGLEPRAATSMDQALAVAEPPIPQPA